MGCNILGRDLEWGRKLTIFAVWILYPYKPDAPMRRRGIDKKPHKLKNTT